MRLEEFDYHLPPELIAQQPPAQRDGGRLMRLDRQTGEVTHHRVSELTDLLPPRALLVVNDSRVIPARLWARRATGGRVEVLLLERQSGNGSRRADDGLDPWSCLTRSSKALRQGEWLTVEPKGPELGPTPRLRVMSAPVEGRCVLGVQGPGLEAHGAMPLPPYIRRAEAPADRERYQTVYAREEGSIAAPTAGLHFSEALLSAIEARGIERRAITLHVGPGTFLPVRTDSVEEHHMEGERYSLSDETAGAIARARADGRTLVAVGTTVVRCLESCGGEASSGRTELFITPGHRFSVVQAMVTNFHLPRSTLLMLISAFAGRERVLAAYRQAVEAGYRFYSFGDAMLIV